MNRLTLSLLLLIVGIAPSGFAHQESNAYLALATDGEQLEGLVDIHVDDLVYALDLDKSGDGTVTWAEVREASDHIESWIRQGIALDQAGAVCTLAPGEMAIEPRQDGDYLRIPFAAKCPDTNKPDSLRYDLIFDLDQQHRVFVSLEGDEHAEQIILSSKDRVLSLASKDQD